MLRWIEQYFTIARSSFVILLGDPFVLLMNLFFVGTTALLAGLPGFTFGEHIRMLSDQMLAMTFSGGCLAASLAAAKLLSEDIENGMLATIMSRPVHISALLFGRWTGIVCMLAVLVSSSCISFLWASRMIYFEEIVETLSLSVFLGIIIFSLILAGLRYYFFRDLTFAYDANILLPMLLFVGLLIIGFWGFEGGAQKNYASLVKWTGALPFAHIFMALLSFAAFACLFAIILNQSNVLVCAMLLFFGGLFIKYFIDMLPGQNAKYIVEVFVPDWQKYWLVSDFVLNTRKILGGFLSLSVHSVFQSFILLCFAAILMSSREIAAKE